MDGGRAYALARIKAVLMTEPGTGITRLESASTTGGAGEEGKGVYGGEDEGGWERSEEIILRLG